MNSDIIWQAFVDTGDPSFYMLYKTASDKEREEKERKDRGGWQTPTATG